ncbi:hypothetical protein 7865G3C9_15 [Haloquadratum phage sp.]|nr:hypothetical protein 7865G3C9_15 [Haloquadratum phage sp.]
MSATTTTATATIYYTINHVVTTETDTETDTDTDTNTSTSTDTNAITPSTVHGDDAVHIWFSNLSDYQIESADIIIEQPPTGFHWEVDMAGYTEHPPELNPESYVSKIKAITTETEFTAIKEAYMAGEIKRVSPWDTPLTDTYTQP